MVELHAVQAVEGDPESPDVSFWAAKELEKLLAEERAARAAMWHWGVSLRPAVLLKLGCMSILSRLCGTPCCTPTCIIIFDLTAHC